MMHMDHVELFSLQSSRIKVLTNLLSSLIRKSGTEISLIFIIIGCYCYFSLLANIMQECQAFSPEISGCGSSLHPTRRLTLSLILLPSSPPPFAYSVFC